MREQQVSTYKIGNIDFNMVIGSYLSRNICKKLLLNDPTGSPQVPPLTQCVPGCAEGANSVNIQAE